MQQTEWVYCPVCGNKTRDRIREDTVLINYPLYLNTPPETVPFGRMNGAHRPPKWCIVAAAMVQE